MIFPLYGKPKMLVTIEEYKLLKRIFPSDPDNITDRIKNELLKQLHDINPRLANRAKKFDDIALDECNCPLQNIKYFKQALRDGFQGCELKTEEKLFFKEYNKYSK